MVMSTILQKPLCIYAKSSKYGAGAQMGAMAPVSWVQEMNNVNKAR